MDWCHEVVPNYWMDIVLFTLITKVLQYPVSLWCQANSLKMVALNEFSDRVCPHGINSSTHPLILVQYAVVCLVDHAPATDRQERQDEVFGCIPHGCAEEALLRRGASPKASLKGPQGAARSVSRC